MRLSIVALLLVVSFQNCGPSGFKTELDKSNAIQASTLEGSGSNDTSGRAPANAEKGSLAISVNGQNKLLARTGKLFQILVEASENELILPGSSSLTAIRGSCLANSSWAPLNKKYSPWTYDMTPVGPNFLIGLNPWKYTTQFDLEMGGCDWKACVQTKNALEACLEISTRCEPNEEIAAEPTCTLATGQTGKNVCNSMGTSYDCVATTCNPLTKPADQVVNYACSSLLGSQYSGTYTETKPYICDSAKLVWILGPGSNDSSSRCIYVPPTTTTTTTVTPPTTTTTTVTPPTTTTTTVAPPTTTTTTMAPNSCPLKRPADYFEELSCESKFGATYAGNYKVTYSTICVAGAWVGTQSDDSSTACWQRQCPQPKPTDSSITVSCSKRNKIYSGEFSVMTSHVCNAAYSWEASITDNFYDQCKPMYQPLSKIVKNGNGDIEVAAGVTAFVDANVEATVLTVNGTLLCGSNETAVIKAKTFILNGTFQCGSNDSPFTGKLTISLAHNGNLQPLTGRELLAQGKTFDPMTAYYRALIVNSGGKLILHGQSPGSFVRLNATVEPGSSVISVNSGVDWKAGDLVVLGPTSYDPLEAETFKLVEDTRNSTLLKLDGVTKYRHWGGAVESYSSQIGNVKLDQRAEVANLSRNIKIQAEDSADQLKFYEENAQVGGHVMISNGGFAQISGVEFYKMGQAGLMGRYPFHWHLVGDGTDQFIRNSSIHDSFQRCITIHGTNNVRVDNNVCYNFRGHGYFLEDGSEINNLIIGNLGIAAQAPFASKVLLSSDNIPDGVGKRFPAVSVFWISNPQNMVNNNIASGSVGTGFWNSFENSALTTNTTAFSYNTAHSTSVGITWDGSRDSSRSADNPNNPADKKLTSAHYSPQSIPNFRGLVVYKNRDAGIYFRGQTVIFNEAIVADNGWSFFLAYNQIVKDSTIIGRSSNNGANEDAYLRRGRDFGANRNNLYEQQIGIVMYDGPFELDRVDFINFPQTSNKATISGEEVDLTVTPIFGIGGADKLINSVNSIRFSPEPIYRVRQEKFRDVYADEHLTQAIRDRDGSLGGQVNGMILGKDAINRTAACIDKSNLDGMTSCPSSVTAGTLRMVSRQYGGFTTLRLPFVVKRSDGVLSYEGADLNSLINKVPAGWGEPNRVLNHAVTLVNSPEYTYEIAMAEDFFGRNKSNDISAQWFSESSTSKLSPLFKLVGYGKNCKLSGASAKGSVAEVKSASDASYFSSGTDFYFKVRADNPYGPIVKGQLNSGVSDAYEKAYSIDCDDNAEIVGVIDSVNADGSVKGWACDYGRTASIDVHLYVNGPAGIGNFIVATKANLASESAVGWACGDASATPHRFRIDLPANVPYSSVAGKKVYVHGISVSGKSNPTIGRSGELGFP